MGYNLKQAFSFVFSDSDFITKWAIGSFILVFPTLSEWFPGIKRIFDNPANYGWLALFLLIALIAQLSVKGYFYKAVHNNVVHDAQKLPDWKDFWIYTKNGLKAYIGGLIFAAPFVLITVGALILLKPFLTTITSLLLVAVLFLVFSFIYLPFSLNFATRLRISAFFRVKRALWLLKGKFKQFLQLYFLCVVLGICGIAVMSMLSLTGLTSLLLPFFAFYLVMVFADLYAQFLNM